MSGWNKKIGCGGGVSCRKGEVRKEQLVFFPNEDKETDEEVL